jgi:hypothetical protein
MNWIDINKQLPPDNNKFGGKTYIVTITCDTWTESKTMIMDWECTTIRNKEVKRWKWYGKPKIEGWIVTHWMELPSPANKLKQ